MPKNPAEILDFQFQYTRNMEKVTRNDKKYQYIPLIDKFCSSGVEFNLSKWNLLFQSTYSSNPLKPRFSQDFSLICFKFIQTSQIIKFF